jgi:hypothetical protein
MRSNLTWAYDSIAQLNQPILIYWVHIQHKECTMQNQEKLNQAIVDFEHW